MANLIGIAGESGSGKSYSLVNFDPKDTFIVNTLGKPLPWKGSMTKYHTKAHNYAETLDYRAIANFIKNVSKTHKHIKNIIIDDLGMVMMQEYMTRANESGYAKFTEIAQHMFAIINESRAASNDLNIALMFHVEDVVSNSIIVSKKVKTVGKMIEEKFDPQAVMTILLYTKVVQDDMEGTVDFKFVTRRHELYPAKTPAGMFDTPLIDNDLKKVFEISREYYGI